MKTSKNKNRKAVSRHTFKTGAKVKYHGKKYEIKRAYFYNGRALAILSDGQQVSAKSLS